ncbi:DUF1460 domain-containing protein [Yersinia massiliensis]|uniref:DUF1460 domain-containing protein n=1 Tax=Yersinia massiliensis TaxID=419257 RepID=A0AA90XSL0_9GAMM|nr:DUF1460 domain-containing protein [Yersinia massiliensis]MDA5547784.1 DUF1460 domain-containing protein [Yersinia massiliensis]NIL25858.1 DUF1460 domain-containing protein [Yersinia massiliensis]UZM77182.1 DUF1460 domain-containing protein [Yersinia massiliensis]
MHKLSLLILIAPLMGCSVKNATSADGITDIDSYTESRIVNIIDTHAKKIDTSRPGEMIDAVSAEFLGTPYKANVLVGSSTNPEKLVIDFRGLDCFTYLDYVNSLRSATSQSDFIKKLVSTRYVNNDISYTHRKHFFSDWSNRQPLNAQDVTAQISPHTVTITKYLNQRENGDEFIPTLGVVKRDITFIPAKFINDDVISHLKTGDYIGIYTKIKGLDVTHTGIFIMTPEGAMLRNASLLKKNMKVVDSPFLQYVKNTPGIIVLRAL